MTTSRPNFSSIRKTILAGVLAGAGLALTGCAGEGGAIWSDDRYVYVSRTWEPKTITLIDTRTGESLWSVDVPVGQQLIVSFSRGTGPNEYKPDEIVWGMAPEGRNSSVGRNNRMPCPGRESRRLDMALRPAPELHGTPMPGSPFNAPQEASAVTTQTGAPGTPVVPRGPAVMPPERRSAQPAPAPGPEPEPVPAPEAEPMRDVPTN